MATVTIGDNDYQAFADVDFADEYLGADALRGPVWETYNETVKGRGLVSGTRLLLRLPWNDGPPSLESPPEVVKEANALLAADIVADPEKGDSASTASNVRRVRAGPAEVEFFRSQEGRPVPPAVWELLTGAGLIGGVADTEAGGAYSGARSRSHFDDDCGRPAWRDTGWPGVDCG